MVQEIFEYNSTFSNIESELGLNTQLKEDEELIGTFSMPDHDKVEKEIDITQAHEDRNTDIEILGD